MAETWDEGQLIADGFERDRGTRLLVPVASEQMKPPLPISGWEPNPAPLQPKAPNP
ncbi:hypothetical protein [Streptomyces sp. NPDC050534]|uniref:hypothetical protein n=1 Tax=Streptomyces sp. NPDC050534 TaxID=3365625 RepID=UPI0037952EC7